MQTDAQVSAANKMWYSLKSRGMLRSNLLSKQHQGSVFRACVLSILLDSTENWFMLAATYIFRSMYIYLSPLIFYCTQQYLQNA